MVAQPRHPDTSMTYRPCPTHGCPTILTPGETCTRCRAARDKARRPNGNPYATPGHQGFREAVLALHPYCVCPGTCDKHTSWCGQRSTVADHHPLERRELIDLGLDPNDPKHGRGLCKPCHDATTARRTPGGWNAPVK